VRVDPDSGKLYRSVFKPIGEALTGETIDAMTGKITPIGTDPATDEEIFNTIKVMGGEDWALWIDQLAKADVLSEGIKTVAYSYIGPSLSYAIYRDGTIGEAKKHLERTAKKMDAELQASLKGRAYISVNKGVVSRLSVSIPIIALYLSVLFKVMKKKGTHESCIEQMERLSPNACTREMLYRPTMSGESASMTSKWTPKSKKKSRNAWPPSHRKTSPKWVTSLVTATTFSSRMDLTSKELTTQPM
jgi:Uncharacterized paraquat-inducible protein B